MFKIILGWTCLVLQVSQGMSSPTISKSYSPQEKSVDRVVNSPAGPILTSKIHLVPNGARVQQNDSFIHIISSNGTKLHSAPMLQSTAGSFRHTAVSPHSRRAFGSGYVAYTWWDNTSPSSISYFATTWTVPAIPENVDNQLLYMFNSIEPDSFNAILQPVLQYGVSPAGGGSYWSVASWWLVGSDVYHSPLTQVSPGQSLQGVMTLQNITSSDGETTYNYNSVFSGILSSEISISSSQELTYAWQALEIYDASGPTDLPRGRTAMRSINLLTQDGQRPSLDWSSSADVNDGFSTAIITNGAVDGEVDLIYPLQ